MVGKTHELTRLGHDSFRIEITATNVAIHSSTTGGGLYAVRLLGLLSSYNGGKLPTGTIEDGAVVQDRGYMLDVSRGRIPQSHRFIELLDYLCLLRYNHVELYMEHTFAYSRHHTVWDGWSPLTPSDIRTLDVECAKRGIELVPNQNSFGHMRTWLEHEQYAHLAECPRGFEDPWGGRRDYPFSFIPADPEVIALLDELYGELLPCFQSDRFNVGLDETFDLSQGRSRARCEAHGKGRVYLEHLQAVHRLVTNHDHTMLFWGDIIQNHSELVGELPPGVTAVEWGYEEDHDFDTRCGTFASDGIPFIAAPGTSLWNTSAGRYTAACTNIDRAVEAVENHRGLGVLLTDWGDNGYVPPPKLAWPLLAYAAFRNWRGSEAEVRNPVRWFLIDSLAASDVQADLLEEVYMAVANVDDAAGGRIMNGSILATALFMYDTPNGKGALENVSPDTLTRYEQILNGAELSLQRLDCGGNGKVEHFQQALHFAVLFARYGLAGLRLHHGGGDLRSMRTVYEELESRHGALWHQDFRDGGYTFSRSFLEKILSYRG